MQANLALCCKETLPILCMGHVTVKTDPFRGERRFLEAICCLLKKPKGVLHLQVQSEIDYAYHTQFDTYNLVGFRYAHAHIRCWCVHGCALPCHCLCLLYSTHAKTGTKGAVRMRSLLSNLRKLSLLSVTVSLPALQPVATRLHELRMSGSRLQGSAYGFLTMGWTALTTLSLNEACMESATMTAALELPALEDLDIAGFRHQGGVLQLDQATASCPSIRQLRLHSDSARDGGGTGLCRTLPKLRRLTHCSLYIGEEPLHRADTDINLPTSLKGLTIEGPFYGKLGRSRDDVLELSWVLSQAAQCIRRGAQLRSVTGIYTDACLQPMQPGASLTEHYQQLGGTLNNLTELDVYGWTTQFFEAIGPVISAAPCLVSVNVTIALCFVRPEFSQICSASLKSMTVTVLERSYVRTPPMVLTFTAGCTRLQEVLVHVQEGVTVKIHCYAGSPECVVPIDVPFGVTERWRAYGLDSWPKEMGVHLLPGPLPSQGVQCYTVSYTCNVTGPQDARTWVPVVVPGFL